jgi:heme-degrading monooxygenase HmoA
MLISKTKTILYPFTFIFIILLNTASMPPKADLCYEMRIYHLEPGKMEGLLNRFRNHTLKLFKKHGITSVGYWQPLENQESKLVFLLSYPSREAREKSWQNFMNDPDWKKALADSEKDGKLMSKIENYFMRTVDFSPTKIAKKSKAGRVFELRTYKTTPNNLENLLARFRNHTFKLFEKHGMTNLWYWTLTDKEQGADDTLIYFLSHPSKEAGLKAFDNFRQDPAWIEARKASEEKAGGSLTVTVDSEYFKPTDFSPIK